jgi:hypothetical protein
MQISKVNAAFRSIGQFQIKHRYLILFLFVILTVICCAGLSQFKIVNGSEGWYGSGDQLKINKDRYESVFGNNHNLGVLVTADDVFSEEILTVIQKLGDRMLSEIPFADKLTSLIEVDIPVGNQEGFEVVKPYEKGIPSDPQALKERKDFILRGNEKTNALINSLVNEKGTETWITLTLLPYEGDADEESLEVGYALDSILKSDEFKSDSYKLYGCGLPYSDVQEEIYEYPDFVLRVLLGFAVMVVCLIIFVRSLLGVVIPAVATVGAIASVLGGMAYFGVKADFALITLPILLGMALSIGYSIHYINMFKLFFYRTGNRKESAVSTIEECGWSVFFTVLTTIASLISFALVDMRPVAWVGQTATLVVLAVYVYVSVLIPVFFSFGKDKAPNAKYEKGATAVDMAFSRWADTVLRRKWLIIFISVVVLAACVPGIMGIQVKLDVLGIGGDKLPHVKKIHELIQKDLGNMYSYSVMISYGEDDVDIFKQPEQIEKLEDLETFLGTLSLTKRSGDKPRVTSVLDILKEMNRALNEGNDEFYTVPEDEYVLAQLIELSNIEMHKDFSELMDDEYRIVTIDVDMAQFQSEEAVKNVRAINQKLAELFPDAQCCILGDMIEFAEMSARMVRGEIKSFMFSFIIIAIMLILAFSSLRTGLIGMIPNVAPVILIAGFMGYLGYYLDYITMTVMPMILGIAVDDTIHLTTHLKYGLEKYGSYQVAMESSFREIGKSMFMTTAILCSIFFVYVLSPLRYIFVIGILCVIGLAGALLADYTITPALLYIVKPFGKEKNKE